MHAFLCIESLQVCLSRKINATGLILCNDFAGRGDRKTYLPEYTSSVSELTGQVVLPQRVYTTADRSGTIRNCRCM